MLPNIKAGDYAAIDRSFYGKKPVRRFDLVVVKDPEGRKEPDGSDTYYLKRVIGLGGETVRVSDGAVYVGGKRLREPYSVISGELVEEFGPLEVPPGEYFLLGDNRADSYDGRYWPRATVGKSYIYAKVMETWAP